MNPFTMPSSRNLADPRDRELEDVWALLRDLYHTAELDEDETERVEALAEEYDRDL